MKNRKSIVVVVLCLCVMLLFSGCVKSTSAKYEDAKKYIIAGEYDKAITAFTEIDGYEDSSKYLTYVKAIQMAENGQYDLAINTLNALKDFSDSELLAVYYQAQQYENNQEYEQADTLYRSIAAFKDSAERIAVLPDLILDRDFAYAKAYLNWYGTAKYMLELMSKTYSTDANKMKQQIYDAAQEELENESFDSAYELFQALAKTRFSDSDLRAKDAIFAKAKHQMTNESYQSALDNLLSLTNYPAAEEPIKECRYQLALQSEQSGQYADAYATYVNLGSYNDCADKAVRFENEYAAAQALLDAGEYDNAKAAFEALNDYSDAQAKVKEADYQKATSLRANGEYEEAIRIFKAIKTYNDAETQIYATYYAEGEAKREAAQYDDAVTAFSNAENYTDAKTQIDETLYQKACALSKSGDYDGAISVYNGLNDYKDSKNLAKQAKADKLYEAGNYADAYDIYATLDEVYQTHMVGYATIYNQAVKYRNEGQYDGAIAIFATLGHYSDAETQIQATYYAKGEAKRNAQDWTGAVTAFKNAGSYSDAETQIGATYYAEGETKRDVQDWEGAITAFTSAGNYDDAAEQISETKYQKAVLLNSSGDYAGAYSIFATIKGYKDVDNLLSSDENLQAAAAAAAAALDAKFSVGNYVTFGTYPQTKAGNDKTAIEWLVLARDGNKALLISRYGLDAQPYNTEETDITWETCTLRAWLNDTFLNKAFTSKEQKGIVLTDVDNSKSQGYSSWSASGGNNMQDKIFLLSYAEANKYFGVTNNDSNNTKARIEPTAYAIAQGASTSSRNKTASGKAAGYWWLRSPGYYQYCAAYVYPDGSLRSSLVNSDSRCARPALWVNLEFEIFQSGI